MNATERVFIGLGSNLADPAAQLRQAVESLGRLAGCSLAGVSGLYMSDSLLPGQPRYSNAIVALDTSLQPLALLDALQAIENEQGRVRAERWGPRTLDLDIILFGGLQLDEPRLRVPHYHLHARPFVLYPLAELVGEGFVLPDGRGLAALLGDCPFVGLERVGDLA